MISFDERVRRANATLREEMDKAASRLRGYVPGDVMDAIMPLVLISAFPEITHKPKKRPKRRRS